VIRQNSFFVHPENLLLAMLTDPRINVQKLAVRRILFAKEETLATVKFKVASLKRDATDYMDMINWMILTT
jgi:hypothetical protein